MKNSPNKGILSCPVCRRNLFNHGSKVERPHPLPRFIEKYYAQIILYWGLACPFLIYAWITWEPWGLGVGRAVGHGLLFLLSLPCAAMFLLKRAFNQYRVTNCPSCGYHHKQKLGRFSW